jgi:hypothetical protein
LEFGAESSVVTDLDGEVESAESPLQFLGIVWDAGDELKLQAIPRYERLDEPFEIQDDVTIPSGQLRLAALAHRGGVRAQAARVRARRGGARRLLRRRRARS